MGNTNVEDVILFINGSRLHEGINMNDHWWLGLKESGIQYDTGRRDHARGRRDPLVGRWGSWQRMKRSTGRKDHARG